MNDILAVLFGVALGTLASVPVALVIAASTTHGPARSRRANLPAVDVPYVELPEPRETGVTVWEARP